MFSLCNLRVGCIKGCIVAVAFDTLHFSALLTLPCEVSKSLECLTSLLCRAYDSMCIPWLFDHVVTVPVSCVQLEVLKQSL